MAAKKKPDKNTPDGTKMNPFHVATPPRTSSLSVDLNRGSEMGIHVAASNAIGDKIRQSDAKMALVSKEDQLATTAAIVALQEGATKLLTDLKAFAGATQIRDNQKDKEEHEESKKPPKLNGTLQTISTHLKEIKDFLKKTFKPGGLSGASASEDKGLAAAKISELLKDKDKGKDEAEKTKSVPWLALLFGGGALIAISKAFGIGAGAGVTGGVLAKLLPKLFKPLKVIAKRIPLIGSLISFYEAYQKFKAGGIDNIIFGVMDIAAGIAYAFPGIGTAIGLGLDVLQYFLKKKADEWKKETGETSFFGNLWDKIMGYLAETPIFKWFTNIGETGKAFWDNPNFETLKALLEATSPYGYFKALFATYSMFEQDAGAAMGLEDESGKSQGLLGWIGEKVDEWILTPVMDFFSNVFKKVGEIMAKVNAGILGFIGRALDNIDMPGYMRNTIKGYLGLPTTEEAATAARTAEAERRGIKIHGEGRAQGQRTATAGARLHADQITEKRAKRAGISLEQFKKIDTEVNDMSSDDPFRVLWRQQKFKEALKSESGIGKKVPEFEELPLLEETEDKYLDKFKPTGGNTTTNVSTQIVSYVQAERPSALLGATAG